MNKIRTATASVMMLFAAITMAQSVNTESVSHTAKFAWNIEAAGNIDLATNDNSSININAFVGFSRSWITFLGVGTGVDFFVSHDYRAFPLQAMLRTSFSNKPRRFFFDARAGVSFFNDKHTTQGALTLSPGVGINLSSTAKYRSYIILGYSYTDLRPFRSLNVDPLHSASIRLGIAF